MELICSRTYNLCRLNILLELSIQIEKLKEFQGPKFQIVGIQKMRRSREILRVAINDYCQILQKFAEFQFVPLLSKLDLPRWNKPRPKADIL